MSTVEEGPNEETPGTAGSLPRIAAGALVTSALADSGLLGMRNAPEPFHPGIWRWYRRLDKPDYTPPDPVFGRVWPLVSSAFGVGGYRLLRQRSTPSQNLTVGLSLGTACMIGGWPEIFFRRHALDASAATSGLMTAGA